MKKKNPLIDKYLIDGCGRCPLVGTPECKVNRWPKELRHLRKLILDSGLTEELKWKLPCYTFENSNVLILSAFKEFCSVNFFKGALLKDPDGVLDRAGENTQSARILKFTSIEEVRQKEDFLKKFIREAIEIEKSGLRVQKSDAQLVFPPELLKIFEGNPDLKNAFLNLTPGRQRAYNIYFTAPKQSRTRESRIEKSIQKILDGKGLNDEYTSKKR
ncbi:MAG: DUF1801 domain-containing protein [Leptospiraceae bacterium]|nr:DUF1801 domain-containing protein [Leptospiraceae bacterium]MCP5511119.1 DUF1801 domain-containing protein [Leptospiraceae bacterium]